MRKTFFLKINDETLRTTNFIVFSVIESAGSEQYKEFVSDCESTHYFILEVSHTIMREKNVS